MRARLAYLVLALFFVNAAAAPVTAEVSIADRDTFRAMVSTQIEAFRRDDAVAAYRLASPTIQGLYPGAERFMAMVRLGYAPLHRARSVTFGTTRDTDDGPVLEVYVSGPDGREWLAVYTFQRQPDGTWRINGCILTEDQGRGA